MTDESSGIGRATAVAFARDGCRKLYLGDISLDGITGIQSALEEEYPDINVKIARLDIADEASVTTFYGDAVKAFGRIDFAANVAGYAHKANKTTLVDTDMYQTCYNVNQRGVRKPVYQTPDYNLTVLHRHFSASGPCCGKC